MNRSALLILVTVLFTLPIMAQRSYDVFSARAGASAMRGAVAVDVDRGAVRSLVVQARPTVSVRVPMPDGALASVVLREHGTSTGASRLTIMGPNGPEHRSLRSEVAVYRGVASGREVVLTFHRDGDVAGSITGPDGRYVISADRTQTNGNTCIVAPQPERAYTCGTEPEDRSPHIDRLVRETHRAMKVPDMVQNEDTITMALAVEADHDLSRSFASSSAATTYVTALIAAMSTTYERELGVKLAISNLRIWSTANDPYESEQSVFDLLDVFVQEYRNNMKDVDRDMAIFLTARGGQGGIARTIGGLCEEDGSYCAGDLNLRMREYPTWSWDVGMMSHEIGHVCGGIHTMSCYWPGGPLDSCVTSESGNCVGQDQTRPTRGTIMSYCHQQIANGATMVLEFHPLHRSVMRAFIRSAACLGSAPPDRTIRLSGRVLDGVTGEPKAGVPLTIRPVINDIYRQTPPVEGDTAITSGADGSYAFTGLAVGLYTISVKPPFAPYPILFDEYSLPNTVMVVSAQTTFDVRVVRGRELSVQIDAGADTTPVVVNVFGEAIPGLVAPGVIRARDTGTVRFARSQVLPLGRYILVPSAIGRRFTPSKREVNLVDGDGTINVSFTSESTLPDSTATVAIAVANREMNGTMESFTMTGGMTYTILKDGSDPVGTGTIPDDGVLVLENTPVNAYYIVDVEVDTNTKVPFLENAWLFPQYNSFSGVFVQRDRRTPLLARTYAFSVKDGTYRGLTEPTVLRNRAFASTAPARIDLPFTVTSIDRAWTHVDVYRNGYMVFGGQTFPSWQTLPLAAYDAAEFVVSPFTSELWPDSTAPQPWHIAWTLEGEAPNRKLVVEWRSFMIRWYDWNEGRAEDIGRFSFQAHIYENGSVDFVYDSASAVTKAVSAQIGLRGNDQLDMAVLAIYEQNVMASAIATYTQSVQFVSFDDARAMPRGLTYEWRSLASSVDDVADETLRRCEPLPATDRVMVRGFTGALNVRVLDLVGATVLMATCPEGNHTLDVRGLASGRYVVVVDSNGAPVAIPLVITR